MINNPLNSVTSIHPATPTPMGALPPSPTERDQDSRTQRAEITSKVAVLFMLTIYLVALIFRLSSFHEQLRQQIIAELQVRSADPELVGVSTSVAIALSISVLIIVWGTFLGIVRWIERIAGFTATRPFQSIPRIGLLSGTVYIALVAKQGIALWWPESDLAVLILTLALMSFSALVANPFRHDSDGAPQRLRIIRAALLILLPLIPATLS